MSAKNAKALRKSLDEFVAAARHIRPTAPVGGRRSAKKSNAATAQARRDELAGIREWAVQAGIEVSNRGRISQHVFDQYAAAHH